MMGEQLDEREGCSGGFDGEPRVGGNGEMIGAFGQPACGTGGGKIWREWDREGLRERGAVKDHDDGLVRSGGGAGEDAGEEEELALRREGLKGACGEGREGAAQRGPGAGPLQSLALGGVEVAAEAHRAQVERPGAGEGDFVSR